MGYSIYAREKNAILDTAEKSHLAARQGGPLVKLFDRFNDPRMYYLNT